MVDLSAFLLEPMSVAEILSGTATIRLGDADYVIKARSIEGDEQWVAGLDMQLRGLLTALEDAGDDATAIVAALAAFPNELIATLVAYDEDGVLPPPEEIRRKARGHELLVAVAKVWRLANPLAAAGFAGMTPRTPTSGTPFWPTTTSPGPSAGLSPKSDVT